MKKRIFIKPVGVVLDKETFDLLVRITKNEQVSKCEFIRNAVRESMDKYQGREGRKDGK
jgi:metal-responsive CopG/Arc/MetJ family transcriptional regulator